MPCSGLRDGLTAALHLGGLWALAFAQPMFGMLGDSAAFFVARGNTRSDIVVFALAYGLAPPLILALLVAAAGRVAPALGRAVLAGLVALLVAALVLPPLGDLLSGSAGAVAAASVVGAGAALAYARTTAGRSFLTVLSPAPVLFVVGFLVFSPVGDLVWPGHASGSVAGPSRSSTPIVHVILDELPVTTLQRPDGSFEEDLFPHLARLVRGATWYRNATTVADSTADAVPAQVTGTEPRAGELPTARDHPQSLFTLFARSHELSVVEPLTDVCPQELCAETRPSAGTRLRALASDLSVAAEHLLLPEDLREGLPPIDDSWQGFDDEAEPEPLGTAATAEGRRKLIAGLMTRLRADDARVGFDRSMAAATRRSARPPLIFLHSTLPHSPWRYLPDGRTYDLRAADWPGLRGIWPDRQWAIDQSFPRHVLQVQYVDTLVGRLLQRLRATGLYDRAIIVVTADHGASFRAGEERRSVRPGNLADIAPVPFIVKYPGQRAGRIDDRAVRTTDVLPTIADAAGVRLPRKVDGIPARKRPASTGTAIGVARAGGPGESQPLARIIALRRERDAREARLLRHGLFAVGPRPDLVGRRVDGAPPARSGASATIAGAADYAHVDTSAPVLPVLVAGSVRGADERTVLAVAVNGRIEATTRLLRRGRRLVYAALVPPAVLRSGANRVTVLAADGAGLVVIGATPLPW